MGHIPYKIIKGRRERNRKTKRENEERRVRDGRKNGGWEEGR